MTVGSGKYIRDRYGRYRTAAAHAAVATGAAIMGLGSVVSGDLHCLLMRRRLRYPLRYPLRQLLRINSH